MEEICALLQGKEKENNSKNNNQTQKSTLNQKLAAVS